MRTRSLLSRFVPSRARPSRRALGWVAAGTTFASLAIACGDRGSRKSLADSAAVTASVGVAPVPPPAAVPPARDEAAQGIMGDASSLRRHSRPAADGAANEKAETFAASGARAPNVTVQTTRTSVSPSMIIRNGWAGVEVDSLDPAIARVRQLAERVGGYVANTTVQGGRDQLRSASLEVKVPSARFDEALNGLAPIGKVESVNVTAEDVGEEYVDVAARVENARRLEARLIALLANRTGRLQDVLSVERELARVREEIERYEGRLRFLRTRVATSTLTVQVHERAPIITPVAGDGPIVVAFRQAWRNFVGFVAALIASLGILIPLAALALVVWLIARRWIPWRPGGDVPPAAGARS